MKKQRKHGNVNEHNGWAPQHIPHATMDSRESETTFDRAAS